MTAPLLLDFLNGIFPQIPRQHSKLFASYGIFSVLNFSGVFVFYLWWIYYFPFYIKHSQPSAIVLIFQVFFSTALFCRIFYHLLAAHIVGPGHTTDKTAFYCKVCESNIVNHDHHCAYLANCVGWKNRRHFLMLLFFGLMGNLYACLMSWAPFKMCVLGYDINEALCSYMETHISGFVVTACFFFPWFFLFVFEVILGLAGITTNQAIKKFRAGNLSWQEIKEKASYRRLRSLLILENDSLFQFMFFPWESDYPPQQPEIGSY